MAAHVSISAISAIRGSFGRPCSGSPTGAGLTAHSRPGTELFQTNLERDAKSHIQVLFQRGQNVTQISTCLRNWCYFGRRTAFLKSLKEAARTKKPPPPNRRGGLGRSESLSDETGAAAARWPQWRSRRTKPARGSRRSSPRNPRSQAGYGCRSPRWRSPCRA